MAPSFTHAVAALDAKSLIRIYGADAPAAAQHRIDVCLRAGDTNTALTMDQARREAIAMLARQTTRSHHR